MSTVKTRFSQFALMAIAAVIVSGPAFATACNNDKSNNGKGNGSGEDAKVTICHATNSQTNPYVIITVSTSSIDEQNNKYLNGHGDHEGGVWYKGIAAHSWGDIIPAFKSPKGAVYAGQNMNEAGKAILNNGCKIKAADVKDNNGKSDDHKVTDQGKPGDKNDKPVVVLPNKTENKPVVGNGNAAPVATTVAAELPHTGAASIVGFTSAAGMATYVAARRFMK